RSFGRRTRPPTARRRDDGFERSPRPRRRRARPRSHPRRQRLLATGLSPGGGPGGRESAPSAPCPVPGRRRMDRGRAGHRGDRTGLLLRSGGGANLRPDGRRARPRRDAGAARPAAPHDRALARTARATHGAGHPVTDLRHARVSGIGSALPGRVVPNTYFENIVETDDQWIQERTGIAFRRFAEDGDTTSTLAATATARALESAGIPAESVDMLILATTTPDRPIPATAAFVQTHLGMTCPAFDL